MPKIITIALNTAIDTIININNFKKGSVQRAENVYSFASGKAINSSKTLNSLGCKSSVLGFYGNNFKELLDNSKNKSKIHFDLFFLESSATRQNLTIVDKEKNELISHVQTTGYTLNKAHILELKQRIKNIINNEDIIILSGSLPLGVNKKTYSELITFIKKLNAKIIFDSSGEELKLGISSKPYVIKPNTKEIADLFNKDEEELTFEDLKFYTRKLLKKGIENVFVTLGKRGAIYGSLQEDRIFFGKLNYKHHFLSGNEIGSGDSFVAGIAYGLVNNKKSTELLTLGICAGSANLYSLGPGNIDMIKFKKFKKLVEIVEL